METTKAPSVNAMASPLPCVIASLPELPRDFAEPLRGTAEGHHPWDLMPGSSMTNAAVTQQVTKQEGKTLTLKYKDGEKTIVVPSDAIVVNLIPGDKADVKPGAKIFIPAWAKSPNGAMEAAVELVGRDSLTPPM